MRGLGKDAAAVESDQVVTATVGAHHTVCEAR